MLPSPPPAPSPWIVSPRPALASNASAFDQRAPRRRRDRQRRLRGGDLRPLDLDQGHARVVRLRGPVERHRLGDRRQRRRQLDRRVPAIRKRITGSVSWFAWVRQNRRSPCLVDRRPVPVSVLLITVQTASNSRRSSISRSTAPHVAADSPNRSAGDPWSAFSSAFAPEMEMIPDDAISDPTLI